MTDYTKLSPTQKLEHWKRFRPATPEESAWKRRAIRQFKAEQKADAADQPIVCPNFIAEMVPTTGVWEVRSTSSDWSTSFGRDQAAAERFADRMNEKTKEF